MLSRFVICFCFLLGLWLVTAPSIIAQGERGYDDITLRSLNLRLNLERGRKTARPERSQQQALAELQEDFTRLQIINIELVKSINAPSGLDYNFIAKSAAEINKRSDRLRNNLALPEADRGIETPLLQSATDELQMKKSMLRLGKLIYSFSHNPLFDEASVVETTTATRARRELDEIVDLSKLIKADTEKLRTMPSQKKP
jgi:hypothetical protein